ncbi:MAG TPA: PhoH family protein [Candidatus Eremiobacteraceae bacterium]|nr:PhoH family protein [Candidatus Eremiobacteraceae bacterium]
MKAKATALAQAEARMRVSIGGLDDRIRLFGQLDANLDALEHATGAQLHVQGDEIVLTGERSAVGAASSALRRMLASASSGRELTVEDVGHALAGEQSEAASIAEPLTVTRKGRPVRPRSAGQRDFVGAVAKHTLTFGIGPAGTGKTFLAVVLALEALRAGKVQRIILSRPAVEAGENLGFLPGDLQEKVDPYLRPLFDALAEVMDPQAVQRAVERGQVEVAPLAYMRGRTLSDSFIVLDEAQNTSDEQMQMFLTRIGSGSRMVVCGDDTQIDLPNPSSSGLLHAEELFTDAPDIAVVRLTEADVVRHPLIRTIIARYARRLR